MKGDIFPAKHNAGCKRELQKTSTQLYYFEHIDEETNF
jgi:hypothetical protein